MTLTPNELDDLRRAKELLEHPGLAIRITNLLGTPLEKGFALLPANWSARVHDATTWSLQKALRIAVRTMGSKKVRRPSDRMHKLLAIGSGGAGGFFGLPALVLELPISTAIMLRSVADHARSQGEDLTRIEARLACLEVFALGGRSRSDDAADAGYFAVRGALAMTIGEAAQFIAERGLVEEAAPAIVRLIASLSSRFSVAVSEKAAAQAMPVIGAIGGGAINALFISHFQDMARGHFIVRRLERTHGAAEVRALYDAL